MRGHQELVPVFFIFCFPRSIMLRIFILRTGPCARSDWSKTHAYQSIFLRLYHKANEEA